MQGIRRLMAALALSACLATVTAAPTAPATTPSLPVPSAATQALAQRVLATADHGGLPFAIVDKHAAVLAVYRGDGALLGISPVLLGRTTGDGSAPGVGERTQQGRLQPGDHTTPAGRFVATPGRNHTGEAVVWVDFEAAFAIHRLRPDTALADRQRRLASPAAADRRVSAGCVVVPAAFYGAVVQRALGSSPSVVYVMPERKRWQAMWQEIERKAL